MLALFEHLLCNKEQQQDYSIYQINVINLSSTFSIVFKFSVLNENYKVKLAAEATYLESFDSSLSFFTISSWHCRISSSICKKITNYSNYA